MSLYLVTGGGGFIGSALVREILRRGDQVRVVDNFLTGRRENLSEVAGRIELHELDITDLDRLAPAFQGVDFVLHQAALNSIPRSVSNPVNSNRNNVDGTLNVLVAARDAGVKRVVSASSSTVYGETLTLPKRESMIPAPVSPYGVTKYAGELYAKVFTHVYGLETVSLRYFNVFGPRQDPASPYSGVFSKFITALLAGKQPTIFGDGEQSRDFTFVDNVVEANLLACTAPSAAGDVFNIAVGERHSLNQTIELLCRIIAKQNAAKLATAIRPIYAPPRAGDIRHSQADISAARERLGYNPKILFEEGLERTVEWYRTLQPVRAESGPA